MSCFARANCFSDNGYLEPGDFNRTVNVLMASDSTPVISRRPKGAWTHRFWEAMLGL